MQTGRQYVIGVEAFQETVPGQRESCATIADMHDTVPDRHPMPKETEATVDEFPVAALYGAPSTNQFALGLIRYWGPVVLYAGFIFYLSSQSSFPDTLPTFVEKLGDKAHHMMAYGLFGLLWYRAFRWSAGPRSARRAALLAIVAATVYGVTDEMHQSFVPLRDADPWDVVADTAGAAVAVFAMDRWVSRRTAAPTTETEN